MPVFGFIIVNFRIKLLEGLVTLFGRHALLGIFCQHPSEDAGNVAEEQCISPRCLRQIQRAAAFWSGRIFRRLAGLAPSNVCQGRDEEFDAIPDDGIDQLRAGYA